ncbi:MAG: bifunctional phosphoribosylaminoimidazolecarboxamide formyltransferase/IMP cyclohydrolase [Gemmataceae bacterium]|nr:bifunctional phosphoribosylaminoimidazolecarboxamide formyltransferase/IMP cyclohydrolase [Gemmataceae bacterium]
MLPIRRVLLSVSDKTGLVELAKELIHWGAELISTGGTKTTLQAAGLTTLDISEVTGFPEMLDGRVKTLHPKIHGGILAIRNNPNHVKTIQEHDIQPIDMVVCNLYPFAQVAANPKSTHEEIVENIDIGGPSMVRSAAKNHHDVAIVTDPGQYPGIVKELQATGGKTSLETREILARDAFTHTARYDQAISRFFHELEGGQFPEKMGLHFDRKQVLRYGENPHQRAAFFSDLSPAKDSLASAAVLHGKELSYNNLLDLDSALNLVREFHQTACVILKHNNPCGAALSATLDLAFRNAYEGDPLSAYGGIVGCNREVDEQTALAMSEPGRFLECILAPGFTPAALEILTTKPSWRKSVRLLATGPFSSVKPGFEFRKVDGGWLVQDRDLIQENLEQAKVASKKQPTPGQFADLQFAYTVCKHVKSNAIVVVSEGKLLGTGAGQMSRVDSVQNALKKAGEKARGAVLASDAFFPFRDGVDEAARAGITAVIQPGGSMRDADAIAAADEHGMTMIFTGIRHFRH